MTITYLPEVPVGKIVPHGKNPRRELRDIPELAASITAQGILEPLLLAPLNGTQYRLIAGHRRLAAAKKAGLASVPCRLDEDLDTPDKQVLAMISENTQRNDLTVLEEGDAYQGLLDLGWTPVKVAKATGRAAKTVKARLAIAGLPDGARKRIDSGQIPLEHAATLAEFAGTPEYDAIARAAGTGNFSWTVQRSREAAAGRAAFAVVEKYCADKGWEVTSVRPEHGRTVMSSWSVPDDVAGALAELLDAPHALVRRDDAADVWHLLHLYDADQPDEDDEDASEIVEDPDARARREARETRDADRQTSRTVRAEWLRGRLAMLNVRDSERLPLLRLLVREAIEYADHDEELAAFTGMPAAPEDAKGWDDDVVAARRAWAEGLTENEAWKALLILMFDLTSCGGPYSDAAQVPSIHVAMALGYPASDFELALITPTTEEETTP